MTETLSWVEIIEREEIQQILAVCANELPHKFSSKHAKSPSRSVFLESELTVFLDTLLKQLKQQSIRSVLQTSPSLPLLLATLCTNDRVRSSNALLGKLTRVIIWFAGARERCHVEELRKLSTLHKMSAAWAAQCIASLLEWQFSRNSEICASLLSPLGCESASDQLALIDLLPKERVNPTPLSQLLSSESDSWENLKAIFRLALLNTKLEPLMHELIDLCCRDVHGENFWNQANSDMLAFMTQMFSAHYKLFARIPESTKTAIFIRLPELFDRQIYSVIEKMLELDDIPDQILDSMARSLTSSNINLYPELHLHSRHCVDVTYRETQNKNVLKLLRSLETFISRGTNGGVDFEILY
eukprot:205494_1